jgi:hypothetical protein
MTQQELEARYRWLLRAYPKGYRRENGAEMIGTLMEAANAGQRRPTAREAAALILRGLQARAGTHHTHPADHAWRGTLRLAALLALVYATAASLADTGAVIPRFVADRAVDYPPELIHPLVTIIAAAALLTVVRGRYLLGLLATLAALAATLVVSFFSLVARDNVTGELHYPPFDLVLRFAASDSTIWPLPLAVLLIAPLLRWPTPGTHRPLAWLLGVLAAVFLLPTQYDVTIGVQPWATVAVMIGFLLWIAVDARATIAAATLLLPLIIASLFLYAQDGWGQPEVFGGVWFWTFVVGAVALISAGAVGLRHQVRM